MPGTNVCSTHGSSERIRAAAKRRIREEAERYADRDTVLRNLGLRATQTLRPCYDENGALRPVNEWPDEVWEVIEEIQTLKYNENPADGRQDEVVKVRAIPGSARIRALEVIATHLGMLDKRIKVNVEGKVDIVAGLLEGRAAAARGETLPSLITEEIEAEVRAVRALPPAGDG